MPTPPRDTAAGARFFCGGIRLRLVRHNYAGANVSNLDVTLRTLQYLAPQAKIIVLMQEREKEHIDKLLDLFPVHAVLTFPVSEQAMLDVLQSST